MNPNGTNSAAEKQRSRLASTGRLFRSYPQRWARVSLLNRKDTTSVSTMTTVVILYEPQPDFAVAIRERRL